MIENFPSIGRKVQKSIKDYCDVRHDSTHGLWHCDECVRKCQDDEKGALVRMAEHRQFITDLARSREEGRRQGREFEEKQSHERARVEQEQEALKRAASVRTRNGCLIGIAILAALGLYAYMQSH